MHLVVSLLLLGTAALALDCGSDGDPLTLDAAVGALCVHLPFPRADRPQPRAAECVGLSYGVPCNTTADPCGAYCCDGRGSCLPKSGPPCGRHDHWCSAALSDLPVTAEQQMDPYFVLVVLALVLAALAVLALLGYSIYLLVACCSAGTPDKSQ